MPRRESIKKPLCQCCNTNRVIDNRNTFCRYCKIFIYHKLQLTSNYVSHKLVSDDYNDRYKTEMKCSLCGKLPIISYKHFEMNKRFYLCKEHHERWLKIGCELSELVNKL